MLAAQLCADTLCVALQASSSQRRAQGVADMGGVVNLVAPYRVIAVWQNGFFADFYFWAAGFFRGFLGRRIFSPHFCGKKCPEKSSRKIPGKILQKLYNKNPRHISAEGPGQHIAWSCDTIAAIPRIARYFSRDVGSPPNWCDTPPLALSFAQAHLCDTPFCYISRDICAIPHKNKHERVSRYYRYKYRAIWKVSLLGLLGSKSSNSTFFSICRSVFVRLGPLGSAPIRQEKGAHTQNSWVRIPPDRVGVFHMKGLEPKSSVCPSKLRKTKPFGGISRHFCWDIPGAPEKFIGPLNRDTRHCLSDTPV